MKLQAMKWIVTGAVLTLLAGSASAQAPRNPSERGPYFGSIHRPTVSPYVNLGTSENGISNYQTLVRPMIEDRAALARQQATLNQMSHRLGGRGQQPPQRGNEANRRGTGVRFMSYSHYFGTVR